MTRAVLLVGALALLAPMSANASVHLTRIATTNGGFEATSPVRTADGTLHLAFHTRASSGGSFNQGIAAVSVSPSGHPGPQVQALSGWGNPDQPALLVLSNGSLEAVFGGAGPSAPSDNGPFGIGSSDGGSTWSPPVDVASHSMEAFAGPISAQMLGAIPVMMLSQAGNLVVQQGFGPTSPTYQVSTPPTVDGFVGNVDSAVDAASGQVIASWVSGATQEGNWLQTVAPSPGAAQKVPGGLQQLEVLAGRDSGPGVFGAYSPDNTHARLLRYGGGSVAVGSLKGLTTKVLGVATGLDGRIWVMWGDDSKAEIAITRSNKAVTRFEPIQHLSSNAFDLWQIFGDGRLGPLDLLVNESMNVPAGQQLSNGIFYARVLPKLSAKVSVKRAGKKFKVSVKVSDAGDVVAGAKVSAKGHHKKTGAKGTAKLKVKGRRGKHVTVKVSAPGYQLLKKKVKL